MSASVHEIKDCIKAKLDEGFRKFIIFPYGDVGVQVKYVLNTAFDIQESYILDNHLPAYNPKIKPLEFLETLDCKEYCLFFATNSLGNLHLKAKVQKYFPEENIAEFASVHCMLAESANFKLPFRPTVGKYSYGPLCEVSAENIESIGAFCSFAVGTAAVSNHEIEYITTHPIISLGANYDYLNPFSEYAGGRYYLPGIQPIFEKVKKHGRSTIGNDVWLGRNVIITNYANIGNGVIAAAGSVITKDVPDYAIVAGVPAQIIRYRYTPEQIEALNEICWWDWPDEKIRECYEDFYLPVDEFIQKHLNRQ